MFREIWIRRAAWLASLALVMVSGLAARAQERVQFAVEVAAPTVSQYWLGLVCDKVDPTLRSHLQLDEDHGLLVREVVPDSPADKVGIEVHDVLLGGDRPLRGDVNQLVELVNRSQGKEIAMNLIRKGKRITIKVTPAKRPNAYSYVPDFKVPVPGNAKELQKWLDQFRQGAPELPFRFRLLRPGIIDRKLGEAPKDLTINITKQADKPAKIIVKKGDKTWEVTDSTLDKLPKEIRQYVERLLRPSPIRGALIPGGQGLPPQPLSEPSLKFGELFVPKWQARPGGDKIEKQLEKMTKQIEALRKAVEELKKP